MKKLLLLVSVISLTFPALGQSSMLKSSKKKKTEAKCAKMFIGTSIGVNNPTGIVGADVDIAFIDNVSFDLGAGISTWGSKTTLGARYYFKPCHKGLALGAGFTHNTGLSNFHQNLETVGGYTENVTLNLKPQSNLYIALCYFWRLGKNGSRFYMGTGWSVPLTAAQYEVTEGDPLSETSDKAIKLIAPGGPMFNIGFSFAILH